MWCMMTLLWSYLWHRDQDRMVDELAARAAATFPR